MTRLREKYAHNLQWTYKDDDQNLSLEFDVYFNLLSGRTHADLSYEFGDCIEATRWFGDFGYESDQSKHGPQPIIDWFEEYMAERDYVFEEFFNACVAHLESITPEWKPD